jgi:P27 family predicted phage terminase small subunit
VGLAEPPAYLPEKAKELWRMVAPDLIATDRLRPEDLPLFEQMCMAYFFSIYAGAMMVKEGIISKDAAHRDTLRSHPSSRVWKDAVGILRQIACEFGVTPSSRSRLELPVGNDDPQDPWTDF